MRSTPSLHCSCPAVFLLSSTRFPGYPTTSWLLAYFSRPTLEQKAVPPTKRRVGGRSGWVSDTSCSEGPGEAYLARRHTHHDAYLPAHPPNLHDARPHHTPSESNGILYYSVVVYQCFLPFHSLPFPFHAPPSSRLPALPGIRLSCVYLLIYVYLALL